MHDKIVSYFLFLLPSQKPARPAARVGHTAESTKPDSLPQLNVLNLISIVLNPTSAPINDQKGLLIITTFHRLLVSH